MDPLLDRDLLFGNPDRAQVRLSPDGRWIAWLAPREGVLNVWVAPVRELDAARPVTDDTDRGVRAYGWLWSSERLVYVQDRQGDENWHVWSVDPATGTSFDLTPIEGVNALLLADSPEHPHELVVGLNDRDPRLHDPWRIDVRTGERSRLLENPGFVGWTFDLDLVPRFAVAPRPDGGHTLFRLGEAPEPFLQIEPEDALTTGIVGFDREGRELYAIDSRGRDTAALVALDPGDGSARVLAEDPRADVSGWIRHPATWRPQAAVSTWDVQRFHVLDPALAPHLERLQAHQEGEIAVASRTVDDRLWVVAYDRPDGPLAYVLYETDTGTLRPLFTNRAALEGQPLAKRHPLVIRSRDGLDLVSYLSLPRWLDRGGRPEHPVPMVLLVHGGPWARDGWGFHPEHQWLANRGYAVLSVNFRASTGFGKRFLNAGDRQWGRAMQDDLVDAVRFAVDEGIALEDRVAIMGGSYGGYATLAGLCFTPELFACGVDIVGPSDLTTFMDTIPPYWAPLRPTLKRRVGDHETEEGRAQLRERSPLHHVDRIVRPLLVAQGANDPRVVKAESDQMVAALRARGVEVQYALFPDEGHGFARPENRLAFYALAEQFLAEHLGGRAQPLAGELERSSVQLTR